MKNFNLYVDKGQDVVIWGLGFYGMNCLYFLQKSTTVKVSVIVDQAKHKIMNEYLGIRIVSPDIFFSSLKNNNYVVLVTVRNAVKFDPQILRSKKVSFFILIKSTFRVIVRLQKK